MKKMMKEKTIKTAAIGLSAIMAMSTPMTAMAAEGEAVIPTEPTDSAKEDQKAAEKTLAKQVNDVKTKEVVEAKEKTSQSASDVETTANKTKDTTLAKEVQTAGSNLEAAHEKKDDKTANEKIEQVDKKLADAAEKAENLNTKVDKASKVVEAVEKTVTEANTKVENAKNTIEEANKNLNSATSIDEAKKAASDAEVAATEANDKLAKANEIVKEKEDKFKKAQDAAAKAKDAYEKAVNKASKLSEDAIKKLEAEKEAAEKLEKQAQAALNNAKLSAADKAALEIIKAQKNIEAENAPKDDWKAADKLFKQIMENYYIPNVLKQNIELAGDFERFGDHNKNYIVGTVKDENGEIVKDENGKPVEKYYNYKLDETGKRLIIFEKTLEEQVTQEEKYVVYDENQNIGVELTKAEFMAKLTSQKDSEIVQAKDGSYYIKKADIDGNIKQPTVDNKLVNKDNGNEKITETAEKTATNKLVNENGEIVEQTIGTVTTTTVNKGVSLQGGSGYKTEEEAKKAAENEAENAKAEGDAINKVDAEITANASATAEITYVTTFETKIDLSGLNTKVWGGYNLKDGKKEVENQVIDNMKSGFKDNEEGFEIIDYSTSNLEMERIKNEGIISEDTYKVKSGTLTVTYKKVMKTEVDQNTLEWLLKGANKGIENVNKDITVGSQILDYDISNGDFETGVGYYLEASTVTVTESASNADAKLAKDEAEKLAIDAAEAKAKEEAQKKIDKEFANKIQNKVNAGKEATTEANIHKKIDHKLKFKVEDFKDIFDPGKWEDIGEIIKGDYNVKEEAVTPVTTGSEVTYSYTGTYDKTNVKTKDKVIYETKTWEADQLTHIEEKKEVVKTNKYYTDYLADKSKTENLFITSSDEEFAKYKEDALNAKKEIKALKDKYREIKQDSVDAANSVEKARDAVEQLKKDIDKLKKKSTVKTAELAELSAQLDAAKKKLADAKEKAEEINKTVDDIKDELEKKIDELTPAPTPETPDAPSTPSTPAGPTTPVAPTVTPAAVTITPIATPLAANVADADADEEGNGVVIDENETPLAGGMEAEVEDGDEEITAIEDTEVPMATAEEDGMSWWWLLLIAILGATGYKMYKKHQEKKAALAEELNK